VRGADLPRRVQLGQLRGDDVPMQQIDRESHDSSEEFVTSGVSACNRSHAEPDERDATALDPGLDRSCRQHPGSQHPVCVAPLCDFDGGRHGRAAVNEHTAVRRRTACAGLPSAVLAMNQLRGHGLGHPHPCGAHIAARNEHPKRFHLLADDELAGESLRG